MKSRGEGMFEPEYRVGFRVLRQEVGLGDTFRIVIPAVLKSLVATHKAQANSEEHEKRKARIKNHFKLLAFMYRGLQRRYGASRANEIVREILMKGGQAFFRGFTPLDPGVDLRRFAQIYKDFESHNIVFEVIEESRHRFEIVVRRCLIYESFNELGLADLTQWMCDIAFAYFSNYHPRMKYSKDRMIARGDDTCHEVFAWE